MDIRVRKYTRVTVLKPYLGRAFSCIERVRKSEREKERGDRSGRKSSRGACYRQGGRQSESAGKRGRERGGITRERETERAEGDRGVAGRGTYDGEDNDART